MYFVNGHSFQKESSMNVIINEFDEKTKFYKMFDLESINKELTSTYRNCHGTIIFSTSKAQHDKTKHCDNMKNKDWKPTLSDHDINPFSTPVEAEETKLGYRMPLEDYPRNNFTSIVLASPVSSLDGKTSVSWVPKLTEIVRVLSTEYDKTNFTF